MRKFEHLVIGKMIIGMAFAIAFLWPGPGKFSYGQTTSSQVATSQNHESDDFNLRVAVEEVRLDAVVLKNGRQMTDLTAEDFEIYQDGKLQQVTSSIYINDDQQTVGRRPSRIGSIGSGRLLSRDKVKRTIAFVVDDLAIPLDSGGFALAHYAQMSIERFVKNQMQPGDMVAVLRTAKGTSAVQQFTADKNRLLAIIKKVNFGIAPSNCLSGGT